MKILLVNYTEETAVIIVDLPFFILVYKQFIRAHVYSLKNLCFLATEDASCPNNFFFFLLCIFRAFY